jgi:hypothetical protein
MKVVGIQTSYMSLGMWIQQLLSLNDQVNESNYEWSAQTLMVIDDDYMIIVTQWVQPSSTKG